MADNPDKTEKKPRLSREEIAAIEVGHTNVGKAVKYYLVGMFLVLILAVPLFEQGYDVYQRSQNNESSLLPYVFDIVDIAPSRELLAETLRYESILHGVQEGNAYVFRNINLYEGTIEDESIISKTLIPPIQAFQLFGLGAGNENAYPGMGQWLFFRPGVEYLTTQGFLAPKVLEARARMGDEWNAPPQPDPVLAITRFRDQLAERDIELVVMPAPVKPSIYPEQFSTRYDGDALLENPSYAPFLARLEEAGVRVCDVAPALLAAKKDAQQFLATDTHWTPDGLETAVQTLAAYLSDAGLVQAGTAEYERVPVEIENLGDIANMFNLPPRLQLYDAEQVTARRVIDGAGVGWKADPNAAILFLGDSFANIYSLEGMGWGSGAGLVEQLSFALRQPLDRIVMNDNGSFATRQQLSRELARGKDRLEGKKLVIWEFAARELSIGDWKLDLPLALGTPESQVVEDGPRVVTGTIAALTQPPKPGDVPYKDCIVALHLTDVAHADDGQPGEMVVFTWGMRDNVWTPAARLETGQQVTLALTPWDSVEADYGSYNRMELDDEALLFLDLYWAESVTPGDETIPVASPDVDTAPLVPVVPVEDTTPPDTETAGETIEADAPVAAWLERVTERLTTSEQDGSTVLPGNADWLFYAPALRSLTAGPFWGAHAAAVSRAKNPEDADPLPAIVDFNNQLEAAGIRLVLAPVPPKAAVYPDKLLEGAPEMPLRVDFYHQQFYETLREAGVEVLDLTPIFSELRAASEDDLYCRQDTHWGGGAIDETAKRFAEIARGEAWYEDIPKRNYIEDWFKTEVAGDLWRALEDPAVPKETLSLEAISETQDDARTPVENWRESPVLLLGDSHCLIFSAGDDMLATGAGLPEHLAKALGFPADVVAVRGSGATPARISLLRRRDNLAGKKIVFWCFTAREFTEAEGGWRVLPVISPDAKSP